MVTFAVFIACWINILGFIYFFPTDLWPDSGSRLLDYARTYFVSEPAFLEDHSANRPDVLDIVPEETVLAVSPPTAGTLPFSFKYDNSSALILPYSFEDANSSVLILLVMLCVLASLLLYKVYRLLRRTFTKPRIEDSLDSKHDEVVDDEVLEFGLKLQPSGSSTDSYNAEEVISFRSPVMTALPVEDFHDDAMDKDVEDTKVTNDTSHVFKHSEEEFRSTPDNQSPENKTDAVEDSADDDLPPANRPPSEDGAEDEVSSAILSETNAMDRWEPPLAVEPNEDDQSGKRSETDVADWCGDITDWCDVPEWEDEPNDDGSETDDKPKIVQREDIHEEKETNASDGVDSSEVLEDANEEENSETQEKKVGDIPEKSEEKANDKVEHENNEQDGNCSNSECGSSEASLQQDDNVTTDKDSQIHVTAIKDFSQESKCKQQPVLTPDPSSSSYGSLEHLRGKKYQFKVDNRYAGLIVGKGGSMAAKYGEEFKVNVKLIKNYSTTSALAILKGYPEDAQRVYEDITAKIDKAKEYDTRKELKKPLDQPEEVAKGLLQVTGNKYAFRIPYHQRQFLVGPAGATVRELQEKFGVVIHTHKKEGYVKHIDCEILGRKDDVLDAFTEIRSRLRNHIL